MESAVGRGWESAASQELAFVLRCDPTATSERAAKRSVSEVGSGAATAAMSPMPIKDVPSAAENVWSRVREKTWG